MLTQIFTVLTIFVIFHFEDIKTHAFVYVTAIFSALHRRQLLKLFLSDFIPLMVFVCDFQCKAQLTEGRE